jgi:hypothetical protein
MAAETSALLPDRWMHRLALAWPNVGQPKEGVTAAANPESDGQAALWSGQPRDNDRRLTLRVKLRSVEEGELDGNEDGSEEDSASEHR